MAVLPCACIRFCLHIFTAWWGTPLQCSPQNPCCNFQHVFISSWQVSNVCFFCFLTCFSLNGSSVWVSSSQSEPVTNLLQIHFYFHPRCPLLSRPRLRKSPLPVHFPICFSLIAFPSLCLCDCLEPLSHICLSFSTILRLTSKSSWETIYN